MLQKRDQSSFYFNGEVIDVDMLAYKHRLPNGCRNHQRGTALCCLAVVAQDLNSGIPICQEYQDKIPQYLKELQ